MAKEMEISTATVVWEGFCIAFL